MDLEKKLEEGFAYATADGKIFVWHENLNEPKEIARRGTHDTRISSLAFSHNCLYDAGTHGAVFSTLESKQVYAAPPRHTIHHIEDVEGALVAMISRVEDRKRNIEFRHLPSDEILDRCTVEETPSWPDLWTTRKSDQGWYIGGFHHYKLIEGTASLLDNIAHDDCFFVRGGEKPLYFYTEPYRLMSHTSLNYINKEICLPGSKFADIHFPDLVGVVHLAVFANNKFYLGIRSMDSKQWKEFGCGQPNLKDILLTYNPLTKETAVLPLASFPIPQKFNVVTPLPKTYIDGLLSPK